jgi:hypothetical protein
MVEDTNSYDNEALEYVWLQFQKFQKNLFKTKKVVA